MTFVWPIIHHCDLSGNYPLRYFRDFGPATFFGAIASSAPRQARLKVSGGGRGSLASTFSWLIFSYHSMNSIPIFLFIFSSIFYSLFLFVAQIFTQQKYFKHFNSNFSPLIKRFSLKIFSFLTASLLFAKMHLVMHKIAHWTSIFISLFQQKKGKSQEPGTKHVLPHRPIARHWEMNARGKNEERRKGKCQQEVSERKIIQEITTWSIIKHVLQYTQQHRPL